MQNKLFAHDSVNVIIVDMLPMFRLGMKTTLENLSYVGNVFEAQNEEDAKLILLNEKISILYLISRSTGINPFSLSIDVMKDYPNTRLVYLSITDDEDEIIKMVQLGIDGFISKYVDLLELDQSIRTVLSNSKYFTPEISNIIAKKLCAKGGKVNANIELSKDRTRDVLFLLCHEFSNCEIANQLCLSHRSIEYHRKKIYIMSGARNQVGILKFALRNGILEDENLLQKWARLLDAKFNTFEISN
ncbi:MAG: response regulator transcription factor [Bacteroidetes bacterium]|nr:MAG: response regulator transcription factor [Bacteroidota bacterium]